METKKKCNDCKKKKKLSLFFKDKSKKDGLSANCKECNKKRSAHHRDKNRVQIRFNQLKYATGVTKEQYIELLNLQNNKCAICDVEFGKTNKKFSVDHCHKTNIIRGLLCARCNFGLGYFLDDIKLLNRATKYLNKNLSFKGLKMKKHES